MAGIPVIMCSMVLPLGEAVMKALLPEVDVLHICNNVSSAQSEIPALVRGKDILPSSGIGSHMTLNTPHRRPVAVLVGGKFTEDEIEAVRQSSENARAVPWFRADLSVVPPGGWPPKPEHASERMKRALRERGLSAESKGVGKGEVWLW